MEYNWSLLNNSNGTSSTTSAYNSVRSHNNGHRAWETTWGSVNHYGGGVISREESWSYPLHSYCSTPSAFYGGGAPRQVEFSAYDHQAVMLQEQEKISTCLKLGKRHYFEDVMAAAPPPTAAAAAAMAKKGKPYCAMAAAEAAQAAVVARCQVEGCGVVLVNAKEYHRRHKVCEMHAKAPKVVVLGIEQRFCQQCSRFHAVSEFDESKRSCRRRLAGHNERRRKSTLEQHHSHKHSQRGRSHDPHSAVNGGECALSLLSSTNYSHSSWNSVATSASAHLPERCSAALRELIAENRASVLACKKKLIPNSYISDQMENYSKLTGSVLRVGLNPHENGAGHVTLDLMRARNSALGFMSGKESDAQNCSELWKVPMGY